ncbi:thioesterase domain-containing protein [Streptomyces sp. NBC_00059]|uniref:thioesterase II family protein n=1 Tax=Streptomyces sp. NBC_00059 TaxID=2975635 RepID=UPI00338ED080
MPYMKADFGMPAACADRDPAVLDCPVTVLVGEDDPQLGTDQAARWRVVSRAGFAAHTVPGGHFYLADAAPFRIITRSWTPDGAPGPCTSPPAGKRDPATGCG